MFIEERHQEILRTITEKGRISIAEIQERFDVSSDSARRDLRILEEKGLLKRTHGGAIPMQQVDTRPPRCRDMKDMEAFDNYVAIAKKAAEYVAPNDVIYLTSGSVGFLMLRHLPRDISYTIVVNSVTLAEELKYWDNIEVYVTGGKMRMHGTTSLVDGFATTFIENMHFDKCFLTGAGFSADFGFSNCTVETAVFQRTVIKNARKSILLMPNQKIAFNAFIKVCDADKFDLLITDWDAIEDELKKIEDLGVAVVVVDQPQTAEH
jgi:DeoR/GlpR family transcriptional regulator of sugar metabolism